jgi:hypothetical protein
MLPLLHCYHRLRQEEQEANPQAAAVAAAAAAGADTSAAVVAPPKKLRGDKLKRANRRAQPGRPRVVVLSPTGELAQQVTLLHLLLIFVSKVQTLTCKTHLRVTA